MEEKLEDVGSLCTERGILDTVRVSWKMVCLCLPSALKVHKHILYAIAAAATLYGQIFAFNVACLFLNYFLDYFPFSPVHIFLLSSDLSDSLHMLSTGSHGT